MKSKGKKKKTSRSRAFARAKQKECFKKYANIVMHKNEFIRSTEAQRTKPNGEKKERAACKDMQPGEKTQKYTQQCPGKCQQTLPKHRPDLKET